MPSPPTTILGVLDRLDHVIEETISSNNYLGIFAYVYRRTTAEIQKAISDKKFDDNNRMEIFDVIFANRYLDAYEKYKSKKQIPKSWLISFEAKDQRLTTLQHLMMGMNAHISFDLGLAAEKVAPKEQIENLKNDFMLVNQILQTIIEEMQTRISRVSKLMFLLDWIGERTDERIINFGIVSSRNFAWKFAIGLSVLDGEAKNILIEQTDNAVALVSKKIKNPPGRILKFVLKIISFFETKKVSRIISLLKN